MAYNEAELKRELKALLDAKYVGPVKKALSANARSTFAHIKSNKKGYKDNSSAASILRKAGRIEAKTNFTSSSITALDSIKINSANVKTATDTLEKIWQNYIKAYSSGNPYVDKGNLSTRKDEFIKFFLAGRFTDFNVADNLPAYLGGDIYELNGETPTHFQLKGVGGTFKMTYSEKYLQYLSDKTMLDFLISTKQIFDINNISEVSAKIKSEKERIIKNIESVNSDYPLKIEKCLKKGDRNSAKILIAEGYKKVVGEIVQWYVFSVPYNGKSHSGDMSFAVPKEKFVAFVASHSNFFTIQTQMNKKRKVYSLRFQPPIHGTLSSSFWRLGLKSENGDQFSLHSPISLSFYMEREKYNKSAGGNFTVQYNEFVRPNGKPSEAFLEVHNALFGGLSF